MWERTGSVILSCLYVFSSFYWESTEFVLFVSWDSLMILPRYQFYNTDTPIYLCIPLSSRFIRYKKQKRIHFHRFSTGVDTHAYAKF